MYPTRTTSYSTKYSYDDDGDGDYDGEAEIHLCHEQCPRVREYLCDGAFELQSTLERQVCHAYTLGLRGRGGSSRGFRGLKGADGGCGRGIN